MDSENITSLCASLFITNCDGPVQLLDGKLMDDALHRLSLCVVGRIMSNKRVNSKAFMQVIGKIWQVNNGMNNESVSGNTFTFHFSDGHDLNRVIAGGPWSFDNALIAMERPAGKGTTDSLSFSLADFWIQIHQIPLLCMTREIGCFLGGLIGQVLDVDGGASGDCVGNFRRDGRRKEQAVAGQTTGEDDSTMPTTIAKTDRVMVEEVPRRSIQVGPEVNAFGPGPSLPQPDECHRESCVVLKCLESQLIYNTDMGRQLDCGHFGRSSVPDSGSKRVGNKKHGPSKLKLGRFGGLGISEVRLVGRCGKRKGRIKEEMDSYGSKKVKRSDRVGDEIEDCGVAQTNRSKDSCEFVSVSDYSVDVTKVVVSPTVEEAGVSAGRLSSAYRSR
ncbi:hypothetical protein Dsin_018494 [Dipteronia sinensis]|uniref:DUF4283 domain-containing protein n=1 Tax=Dipteronia sinensis TaxID=43782 RepID=A0AAE0E1Z4_9ROSI|nr:hypothetical protein Dsin_018494 [Dipteronia sinensis]